MKNRISAFLSLPLVSIDRIALANELRAIGGLEGAIVSSKESA